MIYQKSSSVTEYVRLIEPGVAPFKKFLWFLFYTQPFWGSFISTSIPFWIVVIIIGILFHIISNTHLSLFEKLLILLPLASILGWVYTGSFNLDSTWTIARKTLQQFIFAFAILLTIHTKKEIRVFLSLGVWFAIGTLCFSLHSILIGTYFETNHVDLLTGFERAGGWLGIPNAFSPFLVMSILFCWYSNKVRKKIAFRSLIGIFLIMLITTASRNGIAATILFFAIWQFLDTDKVSNRFFSQRVKKVFVYLCLIIVIFFIIIRFTGNIATSVLTRNIEITSGVISNDRISWWIAHYIATSSWDFSNFIFGINYDEIGFNLEAGLAHALSKEVRALISPVENGFIWIFLGSGIVGISILIALFFISFKKCIAILRDRKGKEKRIGIFVLASIAAFAMQAMFMDLMYLGITTYYYVLMGVAVKFVALSKEKRLLKRELKQ